LQAGWEIFLGFAQVSGVITAAEQAQIRWQGS